MVVGGGGTQRVLIFIELVQIQGGTPNDFTRFMQHGGQWLLMKNIQWSTFMDIHWQPNINWIHLCRGKHNQFTRDVARQSHRGELTNVIADAYVVCLQTHMFCKSYVVSHRRKNTLYLTIASVVVSDILATFVADTDQAPDTIYLQGIAQNHFSLANNINRGNFSPPLLTDLDMDLVQRSFGADKTNGATGTCDSMCLLCL